LGRKEGWRGLTGKEDVSREKLHQSMSAEQGQVFNTLVIETVA
jgi:hypothetical protein